MTTIWVVFFYLNDDHDPVVFFCLSDDHDPVVFFYLNNDLGVVFLSHSVGWCFSI